MNQTATETRGGNGACSLFVDVCTDLLRNGYSVTFRAPGWSMHPTIRDGETITAEPAAPERVKWGDIVLYRVGEALVAHRVVGMRQGRGYSQFLVRGDAPGAENEWVTAGQVLGRVVCAARGKSAIRLANLRARILWMVRYMGYRLKGHLAEGLPWRSRRVLKNLRGHIKELADCHVRPAERVLYSAATPRRGRTIDGLERSGPLTNRR